MDISSFPGGSKSRVNQAGENIRKGIPTSEDLRVIDEWRAAHRQVLNIFLKILLKRTEGKSITVAQRHKRQQTIFDKLKRFSEMKLVRMEDVAGCRLIFRNLKELDSFRTEFNETLLGHKLKNEADKFNYIERPKKTGYRGVHDVYEYCVDSEAGKKFRGLCVEIQYRTLVQHAWATAVEIVGFNTENQPKFQKGDMRYVSAMALASEILARAHEGMIDSISQLSDRKLVEQFLAIDKELGLLRMLRELNAADKTDSIKQRNAILIYSGADNLDIRTFRYAPDALDALFELEREMPDRDIVFVRAGTSEDVRQAFQNYFSDARDFIDAAK
jgi:putative GTP pyrophosphokinase